MQDLIRYSLIVPLIAMAALFWTAGTVKAGEDVAHEESLEEALPFTAGERLTYQIRWGFIRAGYAVLEVHPMMEIDGEEAFHFSLSVRTTSFVDRFYKVRDRIDGFARADLQGSLLYLLKKEEGKNLRDVRVVFDPEAGEARYANFGEEQDPVEIPPATLDPLSVVFVIRAHPLESGSEIVLPISDGRRAAMGVGQVREQRRIRVPAGTYESILFEPDMRDVGGVFDKSGDSPMQIWFSNDERRLPVRISSRVAVGSFHADLISVEQIAAGELAELSAAGVVE